MIATATPVNITSPIVTQICCSIPGCPDPARARGWCGRHYMRWHRYGHPQVMVVHEPRVLPTPAEVIAEMQAALAQVKQLRRGRGGDPVSESRYVRPPGQKCHRCGSNHRTWAAIARCYYQRAADIDGDGDWVVADVHLIGTDRRREVDLRLCQTERAALDWISDQGDCSGTHQSFKVAQLGEFLGLGPVQGGWR